MEFIVKVLSTFYFCIIIIILPLQLQVNWARSERIFKYNQYLHCLDK